MPAAPEISVVIPCLDEEGAVGATVEAAWEGIRRSGRSGEVVVVDNASSDRSAEVAADHGARVVREERRGYGSAYLAGLDHARGAYVVMADADGTYPLRDLPAFVDRLEGGDDLVLGSRFRGTIHGDAMPWLNRRVGNPILTGLLNVFFGVKVSDAHCGMRALRREALPVLDLHSTGMEFASEMVFKAFRRRLRVGEIPIDYFPRTGESKLNRFGDAWRHVRFMLLYSPSWLFLLPGLVLVLAGLAGMIALAGGPVNVLGRRWQIHTMLILVASTLIGAQLVELWALARTYAVTRFGERDRVLERLGGFFTLERGVVLGLLLSLGGAVILAWIVVPWALDGFGELRHEYATALAATMLGLGVQTVFGSFFVGLLTLRVSDDPAPRGVVVAEGADVQERVVTTAS
jgi:glycosyltransferase involved in cell wall biosynthesis